MRIRLVSLPTLGHSSNTKAQYNKSLAIHYSLTSHSKIHHPPVVHRENLEPQCS